MISKEQQAILSLLNDFRCLRILHIEKYMGTHRGSTTLQVKAMLNQLRHMGYVMLKGGLVMLPCRPVNTDILTAFDVMFEITADKKANIFSGRAPYTLFFTVDGVKNAGHYGVSVVKQSMEYDIAHRIVNNRNIKMTLIIVLENEEQKQYFAAVKKAYFAIYDGSKYGYFNAGE